MRTFTGQRLLLNTLIAMAFVLCALLGNAHAADDKKGKAQQERIAKLQQAQQALEQEKGQLQAEKADAEKAAKSAKGELDRLRAQARKEAQNFQFENDALSAKLAQAEQALAQEREKLQALQTSHNQTRTSLRSTEQQLAERSKALNICEANNAGLYKLNIELLQMYEKASTPSGLHGLLGGLTQLNRVVLENEVTAYTDKLDELRVAPTKTQ